MVRAHPLRPCALFVLRGLEAKSFRLPWATWDHSRCMVELSPGHIRCRLLTVDAENDMYHIRTLLMALIFRNITDNSDDMSLIRIHLKMYGLTELHIWLLGGSNSAKRVIKLQK